jgi:ATP dependent DNA ligase C terminal region
MVRTILSGTARMFPSASLQGNSLEKLPKACKECHRDRDLRENFHRHGLWAVKMGSFDPATHCMKRESAASLSMSSMRHDICMSAGSRVGFGVLLLGYFSNSGAFVYAGRVGTGFNEQLLRDLLKRRKLLEQKQSPFVSIPGGATTGRIHYVKPVLVAQIQFNNWTDDGLQRPAAFLGLREDKLAGKVKREAPLSTAEVLRQPPLQFVMCPIP